jgi:hypothetical protein
MELQDSQARTLHWGTIGLAVVLFLVGALALAGPGDAAARLAILLLLAVLVAVQVWVFVQDRRTLAAREADAGWVPPEAAVQATPMAAEGAARMVIRCKQCGQVFPVVDTGARPLVASCTHCGKSGTIKVKG